MPSALAKVDLSVWTDYLEAQNSRIPVLPDIEHLSNRVVRVLGGNPSIMTLQGTNTYIVGTGQSRILIDTGQGEEAWIQHVKEVLELLQITLSHVLLTHWHSDHTGGVSHLIEYRPQYSDRIYKCCPARDQKEIYDGQVFAVEGATVRAVFTPGHSHDHMCFKLDEENALFTGDNVLGHGHSVSEDLGLFTKSLSIMADLGCQLGYPAHGDIIRNLPRKMLGIAKQREYHERQICEKLTMSKFKATLGGGKSKGSLSIPDIAREIYGATVKPETYKMAIEPSLTGSLTKLAEDRKVGFEIVNGEKQWFIRERLVRQIPAKFLRQRTSDTAAAH